MRSAKIRLARAAFAAALAAAPIGDAKAIETYCDGQLSVCRTICGQVTAQGTNRRQSCDTSCDRSAQMCQSTGSYSFAAVEQFMPEFHRQ